MNHLFKINYYHCKKLRFNCFYFSKRVVLDNNKTTYNAVGGSKKVLVPKNSPVYPDDDNNNVDKNINITKSSSYNAAQLSQQEKTLLRSLYEQSKKLGNLGESEEIKSIMDRHNIKSFNDLYDKIK